MDAKKVWKCRTGVRKWSWKMGGGGGGSSKGWNKVGELEL